MPPREQGEKLVGTLVGWKTPKPQVGDWYAALYQSGRVVIFEIVAREDMRDPDDMFFATVEGVNYLDELWGPDKTGLPVPTEAPEGSTEGVPTATGGA